MREFWKDVGTYYSDYARGLICFGFCLRWTYDKGR